MADAGFYQVREYGGIVIDWIGKIMRPPIRCRLSDDGVNWQTAYSVNRWQRRRDYIYLPMPNPLSSIGSAKEQPGQGYGFCVMLKPYEFLLFDQHQFFESIAQDTARGNYPKYLYRHKPTGLWWG